MAEDRTQGTFNGMRQPRKADADTETSSSLIKILEQLSKAGEGRPDPSIADLRNAVGQRALGPLFLVPGLIVASPLSGIPTLSTMAAGIIILIAMQRLIGARHFWLPRAVLRRPFARARLDRMIRFLTPIARILGPLLKPRLQRLVGGVGSYAVAVACAAVAATMPPLEPFPFANSTAGTVISIMALGLTARDGLFVVVGLMLSIALTVFAVWLLA